MSSERKIDPKKIHLKIEDITFGNECMTVAWSSDIGFGEYIIYLDEKKLCGYSECMDRGEDKEFLAEVLKKTSEYIRKNITITG